METIQPGIIGGGEMGKRIRDFKWENTILGDMADWPQSLLTTIHTIIHCRFPMFLWWGPELLCFYNDAYRPSLGQNGKHPSILGQPAKNAWSEIWDVIKPLIDEVMAGRESAWRENQLIPISRNGKMEDVYWTFSYSPVFDESGERAGVLVTCIETTEQVNRIQELKKNRKMLLESESRFRSVVTNAPIAVAVLTGPLYIIQIANSFVLDYWGRTLDQVLNKPLFEALPEIVGQGLEELLNAVLETGKKFVAQELPVRLLRNGQMEDTFVNFIYQRFQDYQTHEHQIIVVAFEVTEMVRSRKILEESETELNKKVHERTRELKQTNEALLLSNAEWEKANASLQEFAYAASHDLKEPIRKIQFYAEMMKSELFPVMPGQINYFDKMLSAASRMQNLIDNILAFSQVGERVGFKETVDLNTVTEQTTNDLEMVISEKKAKIHYQSLPVIQGNTYQIQQVFSNIILNALKFQRSETVPVITISSRQTKGRESSFNLPPKEMDRLFYLIEITDNGIGFDPEHAETIFKIFIRLEQRSAYPGTGIGLSIVKKIIENHQGYISANSQIDVGSTFRILLPFTIDH
jgi:signal transduction histidine kinase